MKSKKILLSLFLVLSVLSGCQAADDEAESPEEEKVEEVDEREDESAAINRNQLGKGYYRPALNEEGHYKTSESRGITRNLDSGINLNLFEKDLIRLSQEDYPTDDYYIQEGQYLSKDQVYSWIGRKSEDNPEGLNPVKSGDEEKRNPNYLNSILELDFFKKEEESLDFSGMTIGLALNSVDYYQAEQFGPTLEQKIKDDQILEKGKEMANEIVRRIREMEDLGNIPIAVALYQQAERDDLSGGVYIAKGKSQPASTLVDDWKTVNEERLVFPLAGQSSAEANAFANFKSEVETFFPNISGITGRAHYIDERLNSLTINIMTQFYGEIEMISYSQYLKQSAATYLPADNHTEIIVESARGVEAFLEKGPEDAEFYSHVFD